MTTCCIAVCGSHIAGTADQISDPSFRNVLMRVTITGRGDKSCDVKPNSLLCVQVQKRKTRVRE